MEIDQRDSTDPNSAKITELVRHLCAAGFTAFDVAQLLNTAIELLLVGDAPDSTQLAADVDAEVDPKAEVSSALQLLGEMEAAAKRALRETEQRVGGPMGERLACIASVVDVRGHRLELLSGLGLLTLPTPTTGSMAIENATTIRQRFRRAGALDEG